jgi:hypothetical protein
MSNAYRSSYEQLVGRRLERVQVGREAVEPFLGRLRTVREKRIARTVSGIVGIAGALMVACTCTRTDGTPTGFLLASSAAMAVTYAAVRGVLLASRRSHGPRPIPPLTGRLDEDLARLDAADPARLVEQVTGAGTTLAMLSAALPLAAISLLSPLTLHFAFCALFGFAPSVTSMAERFSDWIGVSVVIVGHAHVALMAMAIAFGRRLMKQPYGELTAMNIHAEWSKALGIAVIVAATPGIVFLFVPPLLSAITGLVFVPVMFMAARALVLDERSLIEMARVASSAPPP